MSIVQQTHSFNPDGTVTTTTVIPPHANDQLRQILTEEVLTWADLFALKNAEYTGDNAAVLGQAGQFADIWRKIGKLKRVLWDGEHEDVLKSEGVDEILRDLIGHCFLTLHMRHNQNPPPETGLVVGPQIVTAAFDPHAVSARPDLVDVGNVPGVWARPLLRERPYDRELLEFCGQMRTHPEHDQPAHQGKRVQCLGDIARHSMGAPRS